MKDSSRASVMISRSTDNASGRNASKTAGHKYIRQTLI